MRSDDGGLAVADPIDESFHFEATDVTGQKHVTATGVGRKVLVGAVAKALASQMSLADDTAYALHDSRGKVLAEDRPIAESVSPGEALTLAPKAHLG